MSRIGEEEEEGENVGCDPVMTYLLSQPSSPSSLYGSGFEFGYQDEFNNGIPLSSPSPVPLSPLWDLSDGDLHYFSGLHNPIPRRLHHFSTLSFSGLHNPIPRRLHHIFTLSYIDKDDSSLLDMISFWKLVEDELIWFKALTTLMVCSYIIKLCKTLRLVIKDYVVLRGQNNSDLTIAQTVLKLSSLAGSLYQELRSTLREATEFSQAYPLYLNQPQQGFVIPYVASMSVNATGEEAPPVWVLDATQLNGVCEGQTMFEYPRKLFCKNKSHRQHFSFNDNLSERAVSSHSKQINPGLFPGATTFFINNGTDLVIDIDDPFSPLRNLALTIGHILAVAFWTETSVSAELEIEVEQAPAFSQTDPLSLELDEIEGDAGCEVQGISTDTRDKINTISSSKYATSKIVISLEDLQRHFSMTRQEAAKSLGEEKKKESVECNCRRLHSWGSQSNFRDHKFKSLGCPTYGASIQLEENRGCDTYLCLNSDKKQLSTVTLSRTFSLETPDQDLGSLAKEGADYLSLIKFPLILVDFTSSTEEATQGSDAITKIDLEVQKSMVGCDAIKEGNVVCEADGLASITIAENQKHGTILSRKRARGGSLISLEDLQQHCSMTQKDAAKSLGVCLTTVKRACRDHGISSWKRMKKHEAPSELKSMNIAEHDVVAAGSSQTSAIPNSILHAVNPLQDVRSVTVKAEYVDKTIKFDLPYLSEMEELEEQVGKRLKLEVGSFSIEYVDKDGDQIWLTSSEDLRYCIDTWTSMGKSKTIRMFVKLITR